MRATAAGDSGGRDKRPGVPPLSPPCPRRVFEAAVAAAGLDFRSDKLWELYVEWEREQGELRRVTAIYDRVLSIPTQLYSHHWERWGRPPAPAESHPTPPP